MESKIEKQKGIMLGYAQDREAKKKKKTKKKKEMKMRER